MEKLEQVKELLKTLSTDEMDALKDFISESKESNDEQPTTDQPIEQEPAVEEGVADAEVDETEPAPAETDDATDEPADDTPEEEADEEPDTELDEPAEEEVEPEAEEEPKPEDDIPPMQRVAPSELVSDEPPQVLTEEGEELPVDYQQVVEGQNAKIAALEAELKTYKQKIDGAFGYSQKPSMPRNVNPLYDDCENIHIHK